MFSKEASEEARLDEKGWKDKKRKDEAARRERTGKKEGKDKAVRRERTKQKDPLIQITNNLFLRHYDKYNIYIYYIVLFVLYINYPIPRKLFFSCLKLKVIFENVKRYHVTTDLHNRGASANLG